MITNEWRWWDDVYAELCCGTLILWDDCEMRCVANTLVLSASSLAAPEHNGRASDVCKSDWFSAQLADKILYMIRLTSECRPEKCCLTWSSLMSSSQYRVWCFLLFFLSTLFPAQFISLIGWKLEPVHFCLTILIINNLCNYYELRLNVVIFVILFI